MKKKHFASIGLIAAIGIMAVTNGLCAEATVPALSATPHLKGVPFTNVKIEDTFWAPRLETNRTAGIKSNLEGLKKAGNIKNLELAGKGVHDAKQYSGPLFMDSDLYKGMEAAAYTLAQHYDAELDAELDRIIDVIAKAQGEDGYINSYFTVVHPDKRWTNLRDCHELYCIGHMIEGAVAHFQATGKTNFLNVAIKAADCLDSVFGDAEGKRAGYAGHPEIELALMKLWAVTEKDKYRDLARFFTVHRGEKFYAIEHNVDPNKYNGDYWQDGTPIYDTDHICGHAVRATYLLSGCVDIGAATGDDALLAMVRRVWDNAVYKNMYITGGIGSSAHNEGFTENYDLPNDTAYQETCASVAMILLNYRLGLYYGDTKYFDALERALYNGFLAGVNLKGDRYFYVNPLSSEGGHHRSEWFGCACCPPNVARTLASLGQYIYATDGNSIFVNLFVGGEMTTQINGVDVTLKVETNYPWNGKVKITKVSDEPVDFTLRTRIPEWTANHYTSKMKGVTTFERGYDNVYRTWKKGDSVTYEFDMTPKMVQAHPLVKADAGRVAIQRGPVIYCFEQCDQTVDLDTIYLPNDAKFSANFEEKLLGGVETITVDANKSVNQSWVRALYRPMVSVKNSEKTTLKAVPYYAWDNRQPCKMRVWLPNNPSLNVTATEGYEGMAHVKASFVNYNSTPSKINDGSIPKNSKDEPNNSRMHFWNHKGTEEWVEYSWDDPITTATSKIYWFDDTGIGECRLPGSWVIEYKDDQGRWQAVENLNKYEAAIDVWSVLKYKPVTTSTMRIRVKQQSNFSSGIHEWQVLPE